MMKCSVLKGMLIAGLLLSSAGNAAVPPSKPVSPDSSTKETASLMEIYRLALKNDASFAAAKATYKSEAEIVRQTRSALLPQIGVSANTTYNKNSIINAGDSYSGEKNTSWNSHGWSASLDQSLFDLSKWFNLDTAYATDKAAALSLAVTGQQLVYDVAARYFSVLKAQDDMASAEAHLRAVRKQLDQTRERFKVGMVANTDVQEAKAAYDTARVTVIKAKNAITVARQNLFYLTNTSVDQLFKLNQKMPVKGPVPGQVSLWEKRAISQNLSVKQAMTNVTVQHGKLQVARAGHVPTISGNVTYSHSVTKEPSSVATSGGKSNGLTAGITLSIPVFSGGATTSKAAEAGYDLEASQKKEEAAVRQARIDARNSFNTVNADVSQIEAWCQSIVSAASSLKATQSGYEVGTRTIIDVLNGQDALYNAQKQYLDSRYDFILDTLKLKMAAGTLSPEDLSMLDQWMATPSSLPESLTPYCKAE